MATVINNPGTNQSDSGVGMLLIVLIILLLVGLGVYFGLPYVRRSGSPAASNVPAASQAPTIINNTQEGDTAQPSSAPDQGTQINIPDKVDVNINGNVNVSPAP